MTIDKPGSISSIPNRSEDQAVREKKEQTAELVRPENTDAVRSSIKADNSQALQEASRAERVNEIGNQVKSGAYNAKSEDIAGVLLRDLL